MVAFPQCLLLRVDCCHRFNDFCFVQESEQSKIPNMPSLKNPLFGLFFLVSSCVYGQTSISKTYIDMYSGIAMDEMRLNQVPASITLAQGILESSNGRSKLSTECNNHFGIKCKKNWTGTYCNADDDAVNECFRGYATAAESYKDHSLFLKNNVRYSNLFTLDITNYKAWAYGLKQAGYATNPAYPGLLIGLIDRFNLSHYDSMVIFGDDYVGKPDATAIVSEVSTTNGIKSMRARDDDTPKSIAKRHDMGTWQIYRYNDLRRNEKINPGEIVYLKPKRRKAEVAEHVYAEGEDMRDLSQLYGIKLKKLYKKNRLKPGITPADGEVLFMREKRKKSNPIITATTNVSTPTPIKIQNNGDLHYVRQGETLFSLARAYKVSSSDIMTWSNISSTSLSIGQKLIISEPIEANEKIDQNKCIHVVAQGETLYAIAKIYNISVSEIIRINKISGEDLIVGQLLNLKDPETEKKQVQTNKEYYTVKTGETLYSISKSVNLSVKELLELNNMTEPSLKVGQTLRIK